MLPMKKKLIFKSLLRSGNNLVLSNHGYNLCNFIVFLSLLYIAVVVLYLHSNSLYLLYGLFICM